MVALGDLPRLLMLGGAGELLIMPEHDDARPLRVRCSFVDLDATSGFCRIQP